MVVGQDDNIPGPAVSGPNGKLSIEGGQDGGDGDILGLGSYTVPFDYSFGLQLDGALGRKDGELLGGAAFHWFVRDPSDYLAGLYSSYHEWNDIGILRVAGELELYHKGWSFIGLAGVESIDFPSGGDDTHFFGQADVAYYPTDNIKLLAGLHYLLEIPLGSFGAEYQVTAGDTPISLFVRGRFGDRRYEQVSAGVRAYIGGDAGISLAQRHRTTDPTNHTPIWPEATNYCPVNTPVPTGTACQCPPGTSEGESDPGTFQCV